VNSFIRDVVDCDGSYSTSVSSLTKYLVGLDHYHAEALSYT